MTVLYRNIEVRSVLLHGSAKNEFTVVGNTEYDTACCTVEHKQVRYQIKPRYFVILFRNRNMVKYVNAFKYFKPFTLQQQ
jgi:hypothetical protein